MSKKQAHWTAESTDNFLYRVVADFTLQIQNRLDALGWTQDDLAKQLGVTSGRVSQVMNCKGNLSLKTMIEWGKAVGLKIGIIAYDDGDPKNQLGPVWADLFYLSWVEAGKPRTFKRFHKEDGQ